MLHCWLWQFTTVNAVDCTSYLWPCTSFLIRLHGKDCQAPQGLCNFPQSKLCSRGQFKVLQ